MDGTRPKSSGGCSVVAAAAEGCVANFPWILPERRPSAGKQQNKSELFSESSEHNSAGRLSAGRRENNSEGRFSDRGQENESSRAGGSSGMQRENRSGMGEWCLSVGGLETKLGVLGVLANNSRGPPPPLVPPRCFSVISEGRVGVSVTECWMVAEYVLNLFKFQTLLSKAYLQNW